ncbi:hypothetical protein GW17_00047967, partial [Ensete ventricosum]
DVAGVNRESSPPGAAVAPSPLAGCFLPAWGDGTSPHARENSRRRIELYRAYQSSKGPIRTERYVARGRRLAVGPRAARARGRWSGDKSQKFYLTRKDRERYA